MAEVQVSNVSGTVSGTTTSTVTYTEIARFDTRGCGWQGKTVVFIRNTGASNTLHYKIDGYIANTNGVAQALRSETSVGTSTTTTDTTAIIYPYGVVYISVKGNSGNTTYSVDWTTY